MARGQIPQHLTDFVPVDPSTVSGKRNTAEGRIISRPNKRWKHDKRKRGSMNNDKVEKWRAVDGEEVDQRPRRRHRIRTWRRVGVEGIEE